MNDMKYTLYAIPFILTKQAVCPICKTKTEIENRNVVLFNKNAAPISKCRATVWLCRSCDIVFINERLLNDALYYISRSFRINFTKNNNRPMLHPLLLSLKVDKLRLIRKQISSDYYLSQLYNECSLLFFQRLNLINVSKNSTGNPKPSRTLSVPYTHPQKTRISERRCVYLGCSSTAIKGKIFCWDHYQDENYKSK